VSNQCLHNLTVNPTVQPAVESTVGLTVRPTVRSILKPRKCAITLVGNLPVITGDSLKLAARCPISGWCWPSC